MTFPVDELGLISKVEPVAGDFISNQVKIYPTIVEDHIIVDFDSYEGEGVKFELTIVDGTGRVMQNHKINLTAARKIILDINEEIIPGFYIIQINSKDVVKMTTSFLKF